MNGMTNLLPATETQVPPAASREPPRFSIIIPARNEADRIGMALEVLKREDPHEIIVVDGSSQDRTSEIARFGGAIVVASRPGRGLQMNAGAAISTGDLLVFLHADTRLPERFQDHITDVLAQPGVVAGAFPLRIDAPFRLLRIIENAVNWRSRRLGMPYGDQALFMSREVFDRAGGFPDIPVMEDFQMVRRLRRMGKIAIARAPVTTSARRWIARGIWRTTLLNQVCIVAYYLCIPPDRIARWRRTSARPPTRQPRTSSIVL